MVKSKKVLALMMGAIIASSVTSQTAVQVYAHDEESSSSSYSCDGSIGISILNEDESSDNLEPMEDSTAVEKLEKLVYLTSERVYKLCNDGSLWIDDPSNLYVSKGNLIFELVSRTEARLVCLDEERKFNGDVVVPEKVSVDGKLYLVTSIGDKAFCDCGSIENVTLPASITEIGRCAFESCNSLNLRELPENVSEIGNRAFAFCYRLNLRELPKNLSVIDNCTFIGCRNLNLEKLPEDLRGIGYGAFLYCENLQLEELPSNLEIICDRAFESCNKLNLRELPKNLSEIGCRTFANCSDLPLEKLPSGITIIGKEAFTNCQKLQLEELPKDLTKVSRRAFYGCENIKLEVLPNGLERIGKEAFANTGIKTITIPESVIKLGDSSFDTNSIEKITLAQGSRLENNAVVRAYGERIYELQLKAIMQEKEIIIPVEFNAEDPEDICSICMGEFNEENGAFGRLFLCGHYMHMECYEGLVRDEYGNRVHSFNCPICRMKYFLSI